MSSALRSALISHNIRQIYTLAACQKVVKSSTCAAASNSSIGKSFSQHQDTRLCGNLLKGTVAKHGFSLALTRPSSTRTMAAAAELKDSIKLATYSSKGSQPTVGIVQGDNIWPLRLRDALQTSGSSVDDSSMTAVITAWPKIKDSISLSGSGQPLAEVQLHAPIPRPSGTIMCIGKNYEDHVKEVDTWKDTPGISQPSAPKHPIVFTKAPQSVVGPNAAIRYPHGWSSAVDYEAELAVIIGKEGRSISKETAMDYVFGYTILNDVTAREVQKRHQQWFLGKSCDTFCPMGPWIVPATEINGQDLQIQCWVNDELRQNGRTSQLIFSIPDLIATISAGITLEPGDIIATGTPAGVGSGFDPPRHLQPGQVVRIRIEGIGELSNPVE